jgi:hypothetical protein
MWDLESATNEFLQFDLATGEWSAVEVRSKIPTARGHHAATMIDERRMAISGGVFLAVRKTSQVASSAANGMVTVYDDG